MSNDRRSIRSMVVVVLVAGLGWVWTGDWLVRWTGWLDLPGLGGAPVSLAAERGIGMDPDGSATADDPSLDGAGGGGLDPNGSPSSEDPPAGAQGGIGLDPNG